MNKYIRNKDTSFAEKTLGKFKTDVSHLLVGNCGGKKAGPDEQKFADFLGEQDREIKYISAQYGNKDQDRKTGRQQRGALPH